jgi:hypothetical protein
VYVSENSTKEKEEFMDNTELSNGTPVEPDAASEKTTDRRSFIKGMAASTVAAGSLGAAVTGNAKTGSAISPMSCDDPLTRFSRAVLREVPLTQVGGYLNRIGSLGPASFGNACGNGCGSGCGNNCLSAVDVSGYTELTLQQLNDIAANRTGLRSEVLAQIQNLASGL